MAMSDRCELAAVACLAHAQSGARGSIAPWQCLSGQVEHVSGVASLASTKDEQAQHFDVRADANRRDGWRPSSYHEDGLQPSRLSPHRVAEHGTLTPCCALTVLRSKLVGPEGWQNAAGGRPIGHVCRLWYPYGGLRRFGGSPATLGELVVWAGHGGRVGSPAPPRGASEVAENVIYTYSRALGLGYAPISGTLTPRTECWGAQALLLSRVARSVSPVTLWKGRG